MAQHIDTQGFQGEDLKFQLSGFADFERQISALGESVKMDTVLKETLAKAAKSSMQSVYYAALA